MSAPSRRRKTNRVAFWLLFMAVRPFSGTGCRTTGTDGQECADSRPRHRGPPATGQSVRDGHGRRSAVSGSVDKVLRVGGVDYVIDEGDGADIARIVDQVE